MECLKNSFKRVLLSPVTYIVILAFAIRVWNVDSNPAGFFTDEASIGYNAYSVLKTGKDEWGKPLPVFFKAFGEYKNPIYIYSSIPFILIYGPTEKGVRMTSVIYGILTIFSIYLLTKELFNKKVGYLASLFLAISPWHVHLSRIGFELIASLFWVILSFYFLYRWIKGKSDLIYGLISLLIAYFTYYTPKIYLPILVILFIFLNINRIKKNGLSKSDEGKIFIILILFFSLIIPSLIDKTFFARWQEVKSQNITFQDLAEGYLNHFATEFLFTKGDSGFTGQYLTRHSIVGIGQLFWFQLPLILIAFYGFFKNPKWQRPLLFMLGTLLVYPLGSVFTGILPQATRSSLGVIPFQILSALGFYILISLIKQKFARIFVSLIFSGFILFSFINFIDQLKTYPIHSSDYLGWQYGFRQSMDIMKKNQNSFEDLFITHRFNRGEELLKFYNLSYNCGKCKIMSNPISIDVEKKQLFSLRNEDLEEAERLYPELNFRNITQVNLPSGKPELFIGSFEKL